MPSGESGLTGVTGHNSLTLSLGLPTFVLGPDQIQNQRSFVFGPNAISGTNSNDFNVNIIDDPKSYASLLAPVDPAALGFLINSGYNPAKILFLFVSRIQIFRDGIKYEDLNQELTTYVDGKHVFNESYKKFYDRLAQYIDQGLIIKVNPTFVPGVNNATHVILCFDKKWADPRRYRTLYDDKRDIKNMCYQNPRNEPQPISATSPSKDQSFETNYRFTDQENSIVEIQTRSLFGAYRYLGQIAAVRGQLVELSRVRTDLGEMKQLHTGFASDVLLYINHDKTGCWVSVTYQEEQWCVPSAAVGTKQTFAILHALFHLFAAPSEQPVTPTVRITPG